MGSAPHAFAEYVVVDHRFVVPMPEGFDAAAASAVPTGLLTEHGALVKAGFAAGQTVLITGASTGIGMIGAQMAKALGASAVIGTHHPFAGNARRVGRCGSRYCHSDFRAGPERCDAGRLDGPASTINIGQLSYRHLSLHGVSFGFTRTKEMSTTIADLTRDVLPAVARGEIRPVIDENVAWTEFRHVADRLRSGKAVGNIVLTLSGA